MRAYLRDIFAEAADQDFLVKDPARKIKVPAQLRPTDTTTLTWDQLRLALSKLKLRDRLILELDMTNALRPSELFAFRWKRFDYPATTLTIAETVYNGNIRDWGKTKKSLSVIHLAFTRGVHLCEPGRRFLGHWQLSQTSASQTRARPEPA